MILTGIYKIQSNIHPERCYIGSAVNIKQRWLRHINFLKQNKHHSPVLQSHFNKYGLSDLQFSILHECEKDQLLEIEQIYLDNNSPYFNICKSVTMPMLGRKASEATKEKLRIKMLGNKHCLGRAQTEEHKKNRAAALKGKTHTLEANKRQSERLKALGIKPPSRKGMKCVKK